MQTTVTGVFANHQLAATAAAQLSGAGFRADEIHVVDAASPRRWQFIDRCTTDARRALVHGVVSGAILGVGAGLALASHFGLVPATIVGGGAGALGGAALGIAVGRTTASQLRSEIGSEVDAGAVLVSVTTDERHRARVLELLAREGGTGVVSTAATFKAGVLPATLE